ncbi:energy transducer TonB [Flavobacterium gilvum]|uniref:TonB C-terminal domain-containing protein n=1 Tax=Flavobacterium gilvum TaxID=1492737 RepID=A0AAC9N4I3_9FLAO|nr:energy transducer TonB [Flavobacterium gilvum]AOW08306.1 hypothetical protein EM308_01630 [Flavobacterium gilvum]KFC57886.1 transporter [Flavobacterium gilvum]
MNKNLLLLFVLFVVNFASAQATATMVDDAPYNYQDVEVRPEFPGGYTQLMAFIGKNFKLADYEGFGGIIKVAFVIEIDGSITNVKVVKDLGDGTGTEAKRVVSMFPKWSSGEFGGKKVRVLYELPIKVASQG